MGVEVYDGRGSLRVQTRDLTELEAMARQAAELGVASAQEQGVDIADHQSSEHGMVGLAALHAARYALGIYERPYETE